MKNHRLISTTLVLFASFLSCSAQTYICYKCDAKPSLEISIQFNAKEKATNVKYKGQSSSMALIYLREKYHEGGAHPTIDTYYKEMYKGKKTGMYKLTHSGIWDYVEYTRGKDGKKFNFTINHETSIDGGGYRTTPCF